ncbi:MAG TPA: DsbA family protein [Puia sp.]|jgi:predicted DsbA family dithiol-disulfide isomerase
MHPSGVKKRIPNNTVNSTATDGIEIIFYTDPLCCWTWAMWPQWLKFQAAMDRPLKVTYRMAGLLPSWEHYHDALNSISKPIQMGPEWAHAKAVGNVPINDRIWITDPPQSSYPACIAIKAVELQSPAAVVDYFHLLQKAVMVEGQNISRTAVLLNLAGRLAGSYHDFDPFLFREDLLGKKAKTAFGEDLQATKYLNIVRFPTLVVRMTDKAPFSMSGYQTSESLRSALDK